MFLGLLDPDPYFIWTDWAPVPDPSNKKLKKSLDFYCFVTSLCFFIIEEFYKRTFKKE